MTKIEESENPVLAINDLRRRILNDEPVTREELREALMYQRKERFEAHAKIKKKTAKKTKAPVKQISLDEYL